MYVLECIRRRFLGPTSATDAVNPNAATNHSAAVFFRIDCWFKALLLRLSLPGRQCSSSGRPKRAYISRRKGGSIELVPRYKQKREEEKRLPVGRPRLGAKRIGSMISCLRKETPGELHFAVWVTKENVHQSPETSEGLLYDCNHFVNCSTH